MNGAVSRTRGRLWRHRERDGLILVNVLFIVALAAVVVVLMLASQKLAVDRSVRIAAATQAGAFARAGELSAIAALRRDAITAPQTDNPSEPWAAIQERNVAIEGGTFSLAITDDQARFNLNTLSTGGLVAQDRLVRILGVVGARATLAPPIAAFVRVAGPLSNLGDLATIGATPQEIAALGALVTVLPHDTAINLNTADERLLAVLFDSPVTARLVASARQARGGRLEAGDLLQLNAFAPPGTGFTSDFFQSDATVLIGDTSQRIVSSLMRQAGTNGPQVIVYARQRTAAEPVQAPPR